MCGRRPCCRTAGSWRLIDECQDQSFERRGSPAVSGRADRARLGRAEQLDPADPEIDRLWTEEARDRLNAYRRGELEAMTLHEVLASSRRSESPLPQRRSSRAARQ
ncbi:MAG: addiction module protein [Methyloceanibacter sp.]